ncbi:MAG TPA: ATP synthase subunit I [Bryobacteraceae bacterium]|nr:ATP synthase subunit I [Bryobacteraceae bacterium]
MTPADYDRALRRIPSWMAVLTLIGAPIAFHKAGIGAMSGFLLGAAAAWLNLRLIIRAVNRIVRVAASQPEKVRTGSGVRVFAEFAVFAALAFVILGFTGFSLKAAILGFFVCPAAAIAELVYGLFTYDS